MPSRRTEGREVTYRFDLDVPFPILASFLGVIRCYYFRTVGTADLGVQPHYLLPQHIDAPPHPRPECRQRKLKAVSQGGAGRVSQ